MNVIPKMLFALVVSLILQYYFVSRFDELNIDLSQINNFVFYFNITTIIFLLGIARFNTFFNPITLITLFCFSFSYSFIMLSIDQIALSPKSLIIIQVAIFFYVLAASVNNTNTKPSNFIILSNAKRRNLVIFLTFLGIVVYILECITWGFIPITQMFARDTYGDAVGGGYNLLHNAVLLMNIMPGWIYILYKEKIVSKKLFRTIFGISIFISLNYLSKQTILLLLVSIFSAYFFYNKISTFAYLRIFVFCGGLFVGVNYLRLSHFDRNYSEDTSSYVKAVANIDQGKQVSVTEIMFVEYSSKRFSQFEKMVRYAEEIKFNGYGMYTLRPLTAILFLEKLGILQIKTGLDTRANVGTFVIDPYLDFGIIGVIFFSCFYGYLSNTYYFQYKQKRKESIIKLVLIIQFFLMAVFVNYFNTFFIWTVFLFNVFITGGLDHIDNLNKIKSKRLENAI